VAGASCTITAPGSVTQNYTTPQAINGTQVSGDIGVGSKPPIRYAINFTSASQASGPVTQDAHTEAAVGAPASNLAAVSIPHQAPHSSAATTPPASTATSTTATTLATTSTSTSTSTTATPFATTAPSPTTTVVTATTTAPPTTAATIVIGFTP